MLQQPISMDLVICSLSLLPGHKSLDALPVPFICNSWFTDKAKRDIGNEMELCLFCLFDELAFGQFLFLFCLFARRLNILQQGWVVRLVILWPPCYSINSLQVFSKAIHFSGISAYFSWFLKSWWVMADTKSNILYSASGVLLYFKVRSSYCPCSLRSGVTSFTVSLYEGFFLQLSKNSTQLTFCPGTPKSNIN